MSKSRLQGNKLFATLKKHGGDFVAVAAELGERPFRVKDAWKRYAKGSKNPEVAYVDGMVDVQVLLRDRLQQTRKLQVVNTDLRRDLRIAHDTANLNTAIEQALAKPKPVKISTKHKHRKYKTSHEWIFSDLHYGKKCAGYDIDIAQDRVAQYATAIVQQQELTDPQFTRIAFLGDIIENSNKHRDSRAGCSLETAEQIVGAFKLCEAFLDSVLPGAGAVQIVGVAGNHENLLGQGSQMSFMGKAHASHIIYRLLENRFAGQFDVEWIFPDGNYVAVDGTIYEHGDFAMPNEKSMAQQLIKRARQTNMICTRYRQGDKHTATALDAGNLICNGAFFNDRNGTEFSGVVGYCSDPCQVGVIYPDDTIHGGVKFVRLK